jgi:ammonia channel protein AmtB
MVTYETSILFSILFGSIIFPIALIWTNGWLESVGFSDPNHSQSIYLASAICGYVCNIVVGLKFEHKKNIFTAYF